MLLKFIINSHEIELEAGWEALDSLIDHLPDDDPALADAFAVLAQFPISAVRRAVAQKNAITDETVAVLACDPTPEVIDEVVSRHRERISEPALREIIARNWSYMNREIAANVQNYDQADVTEIARLLAGSTDPSVRAVLAGNSSAPKVVIRQLLNDPEGEVRRAARATLTRGY